MVIFPKSPTPLEGTQGEEAVIYEAYFEIKINCTMGVERRDKGSALFHIIRFGTKLYRQIVGIPMGTNCAPLVADLFLYCYERDFMDYFNHDNQADVIEAFNSTSRYLDDL